MSTSDKELIARERFHCARCGVRRGEVMAIRRGEWEMPGLGILLHDEELAVCCRVLYARAQWVARNSDGSIAASSSEWEPDERQWLINNGYTVECVQEEVLYSPGTGAPEN